MAIFKPSRIFAVALIVGAAAWIASGALAPQADVAPASAQDESAKDTPSIPLQKVAVVDTVPEPHQRRVVLSCTTQADKSSMAVSRAGGTIIELQVKRGSLVKAGDVIAVLSDEGREAAVKQAEALLAQRTAEYDANKTLIDRGQAPKNQLAGLEAAVAAAEAAVAVAHAEADRSVVRAPIDGMVDEVPAELGQAIQTGGDIAEIVDPDPMLAVGAVGERQRGSLQVGQSATVRFIDESEAEGTVSFVGLSAEASTRTYRVEARLANPEATIAEGVSCEMVVSLDPIDATKVPRSALVFSDEGRLGVRVVDPDDTARFAPVGIVDDGQQFVWLTGLDGPAAVIVVGQDFVKDGDQVEAVTQGGETGTASADGEPPA